jgi:hypothetical protein
VRGLDGDRSARASVDGCSYLFPQRVCWLFLTGGDVVTAQVEYLGCEFYAEGVPLA